MTDQVNLEVIWGSTGSSTDPGDINYKQGWVSEIPTYQEFNFVLKSLDTNMLTLAEKGGWVWQADINYKAGASVITTAGKIARCKTDNINNDPDLDTNGDYWVSGMLLGAAAPNTLTIKDGVLVKDVNARAATTWDGNDVTVSNDNALIALNTTGVSTNNILIGNVSGKLVAIDVGTTSTPDGRSVALANGSVHKIYHEGNKPTQSDVSGTIPDSATDGKIYARKNGAWVEVTTTIVSETAPTVKGAGQGWFNLGDGQFYVDINDGDSSQWVLANPPIIPEQTASATSYDDTSNDYGDNVQAAITNLVEQTVNKNWLINGHFQIWQRGVSILNTNTETYQADRWYSTNGNGVCTVSREDFALGQTDVPGNPSYFLKYNMTTASPATNNPRVAQRIKSARSLAGKEVTLTFYAKVASNISLSSDLTSGIKLVQNFGSGGTPSGEVITGIVDSPSITTSWAKYSYTFTVPSISGKTLGTDDDGYVEIRIPTFHAVNSLELANMKLEVGAVSTHNEQLPFLEDVELCYPYYEKTYDYDTAIGSNTQDGVLSDNYDGSASNDAKMMWHFKAKHIYPPTVTPYNPNDGTVGELRTGSGKDAQCLSSSIGEDRATMIANSNTDQTGTQVFVHGTAESEL